MVSAALEFRGLSRDFGAVRAVADLSLRVSGGEVYGFVGPNGAGKTTTIRAALGLIRPTGGAIVLFGAGRPSPVLMEEVGYCGGDANFYQHLTGLEYLKLVDSLRRKRSLERARALAGELRLDLQQRLSRLSRGDKQKVNIIQSVMHAPRLLVMDEPAIALDPLMQDKLLSLIGELRASGAAVFISSHQLYDIERVADRIGFISRGVLIREASIGEIRRSLVSRVTVTFKRRPPYRSLAAAGARVHGGAGRGPYRLETADVDRLLPVLAKLGVEEIEIRRAGLEEYFMDCYGGIGS